MKIKSIGWDEWFQGQLTDQDQALVPARVIRQDASGYTLLGEQGEIRANLSIQLTKEAPSRSEIPAVGDWVLLKINRKSQTKDHAVAEGTIQKLLERKTKLSRKEPGDRIEEQIIAANIDTVFLVTGLDQDFNLRRTERYLVIAKMSGASPVIILNKCDLKEDQSDKTEQLKSIAGNIPVHLVSALTGEGMDLLPQYLAQGETLALVGSSGVGKSSIINYLLGTKKFQTKQVRASDSRGRHTTTFRELVTIPGSGMIIDTPGMREIQFWGGEDVLETSFKDVADLAHQCRFSDCQHESEPGCAIKAAIESQILDVNRLKSYQKIQSEIQSLAKQTKAKKLSAQKIKPKTINESKGKKR